LRLQSKFGLRLLPEVYALYNPLTYDEARSLEVELGIDLQEGVIDAQFHQIAGPELAIKPQIKQCKLSRPAV